MLIIGSSNLQELHSQTMPLELLEQLIESGPLMQFKEFPNRFQLAPMKGLFKNDPLAEQPRFLAEGLFYYQLLDDIEIDEKFELNIYNIIRDIPSMKGISYINAITEKPDILFPEAYIIQTQDKPKTLQFLEPITYIP